MGMLVPRQSIRADHRGGVRENAPHVLLINAVIDGARRLQASRGVKLSKAPFGGDVGESAAGSFGEGGAPRDIDLDSRVDLLQVESAGSGSVGIAVAANALSRCALARALAEPRRCGPNLRCRRTSNAK